jgi:hypothetical protein
MLRSNRQVRSDNPFQSRKGNELKKVNVGLAGQTPKKIIPLSTNEQHTQEYSLGITHHNILSAKEFLLSNRPKTGRGKHNPNPDEFFDYILPSPSNRKGSSSRLVIDPETERGVLLEDRRGGNVDFGRNISSERHEISDKYLLGLNLEGISRNKQVALLGCWLFGSALKI